MRSANLVQMTRRQGANLRATVVRVAHWLWRHPTYRLLIQIAVLVAITRIGLTIIGLIGQHALSDTFRALPPMPFFDRGDEWRQTVSGFEAVRLWFAWDASIYLDNARHLFDWPLSSHDIRFFAFFPLLPILATIGSILTLGKIQYAMLLVSNLALIGAAYFIYRWTELSPRDSGAPWRSVKYLLLLPGAFLFSAPITESLFIFWAIGALYWTRRENWRLMALFAAGAATTRSYGLLLCIPILIEIAHTRGFRLGWSNLRHYVRAALWLIVPLLAFGLVLALGKAGRGDWLAYKHIQELHWGIRIQNPLPIVHWGLSVTSQALHDKTWIGLAPLSLVALGTAMRRVRPSLLAYAVIYTAVPFSIGFNPAYAGIIRYTSVIFPAALVLASFTRRRWADEALTISLALVQGGLMVLWVNHRLGYIV